MNIKTLFQSIKKLFYEYFEIRESLKIKSTNYFNTSKIYYINNFNGDEIPDTEKIEIIYGIQPRLGGKYATVGFVWGDEQNKKIYNVNQHLNLKTRNKSHESWISAVSMSAIVISEYISTNTPQVIIIFSNEQNKLKKYKTKSFIKLLENYVGDKYIVSNEHEEAIYLLNKKGYDDEVIISVKRFLSIYGLRNLTQH